MKKSNQQLQKEHPPILSGLLFVLMIFFIPMFTWAIGGSRGMKTGKFLMPHIVQRAKVHVSAGSGVLAFPSNVKAGNKLLACVTMEDDPYITKPTNLMSDNVGDTFIDLPMAFDDEDWSSSTQCWYVSSAIGGATTLTMINPENGELLLFIFEIAGAKGIDQIGIKSGHMYSHMSLQTTGPVLFPWEYQIMLGASLKDDSTWTLDPSFKVLDTYINSPKWISAAVAERTVNNVANTYSPITFSMPWEYVGWEVVVISFRPTIFPILPFTWTGLAGDNLWTTAGNWSTNAVPGVSDVAKFLDGDCIGSACNVTITGTINVGGIHIGGGYGGTLTRSGAVTMNIGSSGWKQVGGTFTGGTGNITITDGAFKFGGGLFNQPVGDLKVIAATAAGYEVFSAATQIGTFNMGSGTLYLTLNSSGCVNGTHYTVQLNQEYGTNINNLRLGGGHPSSNNLCYWDIDGDFNATGSLLTGRDQANGGILVTGGWHKIGGDVTIAAGSSGGNYGLRFDGTGTQNFTQAAGTTQSSGYFDVWKASGTVLWGSTMTFNNTLLRVDKGIVDLNGYNTTGLSYYRIGTLGHVRQRNAGTVTASSHAYVSGCTWEIYGTNSINFSWTSSNCNFLINKSGGAYANVAGATTTYGSVTITNGSQLRIGSGITFSVRGDWINNLGGTWLPGTGTVNFNGTTLQKIYGSNTFYNLTKSVTATLSLLFEGGTTQTITNACTLTGSGAATKLSLHSISPGTSWSIDAQGARTLNYLNVQDSNNIHATPMAGTATSIDSGGNTNWTF